MEEKETNKNTGSQAEAYAAHDAGDEENASPLKG